MGECGLRGGYVEVVNMDKDVFAHLKKMCSAKLCSTVIGQVLLIFWPSSILSTVNLFIPFYFCHNEDLLL